MMYTYSVKMLISKMIFDQHKYTGREKSIRTCKLSNVMSVIYLAKFASK